MNAAKYSFVRTALSSPNRYLLSSISENSSSGSTASQRALIAIQSGLKFDCRHPAKVVMLGRVLRPASAVRPTGELAAFLVFRIGRHRQSSWASRPIIVLALLLSCFSMRRGGQTNSAHLCSAGRRGKRHVPEYSAT